MIRVVLDTNVLASGIVRRHQDAPSVRLFDEWRAGTFELVISEVIFEEVSRTLETPYFRARLAAEEIKQALGVLRRHALLTRITATVEGIADHPEDDLILATCVSGNADILVTGDAALLQLKEFRGVQIMSPRDFASSL